MENFELHLSNILNIISTKGASGFDTEKVDELERLLYECQNKQRSDEYVNQVADSIYDTLYEMLKEIKPESGVFSEIWDEDEGDSFDDGNEDYTELLQKNPMMSIETAKSYDCDAIVGFIERMPYGPESYFASYKINGHGIRVVYEDGYLVSATSRARSSKGRDLTRQCKVFMDDYNEALAEYGRVELRGEACLRLENLEKAREFNPTIKSAFSAVSSLIRPSSTDEELSLLEFLCYGFIVDGFTFDTREEEFQLIQECGLKTPEYMLIESATQNELIDTMKSTIEAMEESYEDFGYYCDGIVFEINNRDLFNSMGVTGNHRDGNIALKVGIWKQDQYPGYVQAIMWTKGKSKMSPVAIVAESPNKICFDDDGNISNYDDLGVLTSQGNSVKRVPLYEPKNILILSAYPGEVLHFRYGGEAGVVPCFADGRILKEDVAVDLVNGENAPWDFND